MTSRRPLEEILDPTFLSDGLASSSEEIRARLRDCEAAEDELSYVRRILHGRIDIVRAELERRSSPQDQGSLIDRLGTILADRPGGNRGARVHIPSEVPETTGRADAIVSEVHLARLPDMDVSEIERVASRLADAEAGVSADRRKLHGIIDGLKSEIARRYREGLAEPSEVLPRSTRSDDE